MTRNKIFALMYFGPTVKEFLPEDGDTRKLALLLLGATAVGCAIFTLYASMLFFGIKAENTVFSWLWESRRRPWGLCSLKNWLCLQGRRHPWDY